MKTSEMPVGSHVVYDRYQSRDRHNFVEAYVIAHRPKGNKSNYWGGRTGNNDTVGIMYLEPWQREKDNPEISFHWVSPRDIHYTWDEWTEIEKARKDREKVAETRAKQAKKDRINLMSTIPAEVKSLFSDYQIEYMIKGHNPSVTMTVEFLHKLVKAAQSAHPDVKEKRIADEVESALRLLG